MLPLILLAALGVLGLLGLGVIILEWPARATRPPEDPTPPAEEQ